MTIGSWEPNEEQFQLDLRNIMVRATDNPAPDAKDGTAIAYMTRTRGDKEVGFTMYFEGTPTPDEIKETAHRLMKSGAWGVDYHAIKVLVQALKFSAKQYAEWDRKKWLQMWVDDGFQGYHVEPIKLVPTAQVQGQSEKPPSEDAKCYACRLTGPLCPACGLPILQHTSPYENFATCADTINYRLKRAAAYWEEKRVNDLVEIFEKAEEKKDV